MKKLFLICLLLISFLGAAQETTKRYTHAQAVEFGVKTEVKEETSYVTYNYQNKAQIQITFDDGETILLRYVELLPPDESIKILCETENGTQITVEIPTGGDVVRFIFAENYYITLFSF